MLRYFYIIICIQVCFCSVYVDNNIDYETLDRRVRSKTTRLHRKPTRTPRKAKVVQFDVHDFIRKPDVDEVEDYRFHGYRNKKRDNRFTVANDVTLVNTQDNTNERNKIIDYSTNLQTGISRVNTRSNSDKYVNPRHYNLNSLSLDGKKSAKLSHDHKKSTNSNKHNKLASDKKMPENPERKCSFRHMKIPFFSRNKSTAKAKRLKKRRIFCFNCNKKTSPMSSRTQVSSATDNLDTKTDEFNKDNPTPNPIDKPNSGLNKVSKRSYGPLCPRCIKELLQNLKKKTTKKPKYTSTTEKTTKSTSKKRTTTQKADLDDSLQDGFYNGERIKRNEDEEQERDRRLKELEEVEKKIENVHVIAPNFKGSLNS